MKMPKLTDLLLIVIYKFILEISFATWILPVYGYELQYQLYGTVNDFKVIIGYLAVPLLLILNEGLDSKAGITRFVMLIQLLFIITPYFVLYGQEDLPTWHAVLLVLGYVGVILAQRFIPRIRIPPLGPALRGCFMAVLIGICAYVYFGLIATGGLGRMNFDFSKVYDFRTQDELSALPGFGYFVSWFGYVLNMAWLILAMRSRKYMQVLAALFLQVLFFGMTNSKAFLFVPLAIIGLSKLQMYIDTRRAFLIGSCAAIGVLLALNAVGINYGAGLLDRIFFLPAALHDLYFDYFSTHPLALMPGGLIGGFLGSPYTKPAVSVVAQAYWGKDFSPNVGWIGDAYANFGVAGIAIFSVVLASVLKVADQLANRGSNQGDYVLLMMGPTLALCSAGLGTVLLTHGLAIALLVLWVVGPRQQSSASLAETADGTG